MSLRVTAVIPTRNRSRLLGDAVESVRSQTAPPAEIIVVDDGSEPPHRERARALSGDDLRVIALEERVGGSAARNIGWRAGSGSLVAFLDDDDRWEPRKLEAQRPLFDDAEVRWSWTAYRTVYDEDGATRDVLRPRDASFESLLRISSLACSTLVARRSLLEEVGGFDETLPRNQDWDLFLRLTRAAEGAYVDEPLTVMRHHLPDPEKDIRGRRLFVEKWGDAIEALDPDDRGDVWADHHWLLWVAYAQKGDLERERHHLWEALRRRPLDLRYLRSLALTILHHLGWRGRHAGGRASA